MNDIQFNQEKVEAIWDEVMPLVEKHYKEIAHYKDIPLSPDKDLYLLAEKNGRLKVFTVRREGNLVGYQAMLVGNNLHYSTSLQAMADVLFLDPSLRGKMIGARFMRWCDDQLRSMGVQVVTHHMKFKHPFSAILRRMGYEPIDEIWSRRLD